jgi:membrane protein YqaA with SNARE-associated domain
MKYILPVVGGVCAYVFGRIGHDAMARAAMLRTYDNVRAASYTSVATASYMVAVLAIVGLLIGIAMMWEDR